MMLPASSSDFFYSRLPVNQIPLSELLLESHLFYALPEDWQIIITDIKKSTEAVAAGKHETVNLAATGSIVAILNIAYSHEITIPFFFGGDGASFLVPGTIKDLCMQALLQHSENINKNFGLTLRVGNVSVKEIIEKGHQLKISKLKSSDLFSIPIVIGDGIVYAEKVIKGEDYLVENKLTDQHNLDMSGMQCRWDKIKPPTLSEEVVSLLIIANNHQNQAPVFKKVVDLLNQTYGEAEKRNPITVERLKLKTTLQKLSNESKVKFGISRIGWLVTNWLKLLLGPFYFKTKQGKKYLTQLVQLTDTLVVDGRINTVISGTVAQRQELIQSLTELENQNEILYGYYTSGESVISCYVRSMNENHIHFIDGADGGYTMAARMLKQKMAAKPVISK
ncbi:MAG TPA: DUF3095 family protein [Chitinophagaceae bacterium]|nr:DUF3095 family protein [Chitinophagaceae bacterium]HMX76941.1 DUF3095 family protein [Chitinophagaceae bacterium]HNA18536.1 DUF3095 family protein [Chitinophagaceae bacterium]HNF46027.1 DUF3095 family protein [Chitinophagaceae bacterium]HNJ55070.1 DUF3095 family protein [Chitinophagaceae bacterium]